MLLQVNISGEESKHGFSPEDARGALEAMGEMSHLKVRGLMTMAPASESSDASRRHFAKLAALGDELGLSELSMGMTGDFEAAIAEGSTEVRIGTALFN